MTAEVHTLTEVLAQPQPSFENLLQRQYRRARFIRECIGSAGLTNTLKVVYDRKFTDQSRPQSIEIKDERYLKFPLRLVTVGGDLSVYQEIIDQGVYRLSENLANRVDGQPIVDIGAYIGITPAYFASRYPNSPVLAIEPQPRNFELLEHNSIPYAGQIEPLHAAFGPQEGTAVAFKHAAGQHNYVTYSFTNGYDFSGNGTPAVETITPNGVLERLGELGRIGLLKVDIEGAEKAVFESPAIEPLLKRTDLLLVETHDRFVPGSSYAVQSAAERAELARWQPANDHTTIYSRL